MAQITRIERMERVEDILQRKIKNTEMELESLGEMKDTEICRLRIMYILDLQEMRHSLIGLRRRIDLEYMTRARERAFHDQIGNIGKVPGAGAGCEKDQQRGMPERGGRRRAGGGVRPVQPDGAEPAGDDAGETVRAGDIHPDDLKDALRKWQREQMVEDAKRNRWETLRNIDEEDNYVGIMAEEERLRF